MEIDYKVIEQSFDFRRESTNRDIFLISTQREKQMTRWLRKLILVFMLMVMSACTVQPVQPAASTAATPAATAEATAGGGANLSGNLTVFAAASLTGAFGQIGKDFEAAHPGTKVTYNFAGSQQLAQQLQQGAPADVFASANAKQMQVAVDAGRVVSGTARTFVRNRLVVIYPKENPAAISTLQDLAKPGVKLILAAAEVPVGGYSLDFFKKASSNVGFGDTYSETVMSNVVSFEDNVRSVLSKVALGEADAGIVYTSDVTGDGADQVGQLEIADDLNTIASYPIATISDGVNPDLAQAFM